FLMSALLMTFYPAIGPLTETMTMRAAIDQGLNYGRVRLWCSVTFIVASSGMGWLLEWQPSAIIGFGLVGAIAINVSGAYLLTPDLAEPGHKGSRGVQIAAMWQMVRHPLFLTGVMSASLIQSSHAVYYAFGTLNWQRLGYSETLIGGLWALGVIAEIVLFALSKGVIARVGASRLMIIAAVGAIIRWGAMAANPPLWGVILLQLLHAASFGAAHLAAIHFVAHAAPRSLGATAQSLYASLSAGLAMGVVTLMAGPLYVHYHEKAFLLSVVVSLAALVGTFVIATRWNGGALIGEKTGNDGQGDPYRGGAGC
ncbi:MAG: MFS transporter, partial [Parvibaculum sp.]